MPWTWSKRNKLSSSMIVSDKEKIMPRDLPDEIPGSGTGLGYSPPREEDIEDISSAYSLASTAHDLVLEHGRRYPSYRYGQSPMPSGDSLARQNENALHNLMLFLLQNKCFSAPIEKPLNVLDVKCGELGLWAKTMADVYPDAQITGMDVNKPDPESRPNLEFHIQSYNDEWILDEVLQAHGKFDLIFARHLFASSSDFPEFYKQCFDNLEPGGYLEQNEFEIIPRCDDDSYHSDSIIPKLASKVPDLSQAFGTDYELALKMRTMIEKAGFVDLQEERTKMPLSPWPTPGTDYHEVGRLFQKFYETGLQGWMIQPMVKYMGYSIEEVNALCEKALSEIEQNDQHWYFTSIQITARKPPDTPT